MMFTMVFMCHVYFWTCSWETCWGPPWWGCRCPPRICSHWPCHDTYNGFDVPCVFWNMFLGNLLNFPLLSFLMFTCSSSNRSHPKCQVWHIKSTYYTWFCLIGDSPSSQKCNLRNFIIFWIFDLDFDLGLEKIISDINLSNIKMFQTSTNFKTAILNFVNFHSKNMRLHYIVWLLSWFLEVVSSLHWQTTHHSWNKNSKIIFRIGNQIHTLMVVGQKSAVCPK